MFSYRHISLTKIRMSRSKLETMESWEAGVMESWNMGVPGRRQFPASGFRSGWLHESSLS